MSFYVSEDLKERITENELIKDHPGIKPKMHELENSSKLGLNVKSGEDLFFVGIEKFKRLSDSKLKVCVNLNLSHVGQIFFKKLSTFEIKR